VAEEEKGVMSIHPDDPPWPHRGGGKKKGKEERPANRRDFFPGSLEKNRNDLPAMVRRIGKGKERKKRKEKENSTRRRIHRADLNSRRYEKK